MKVKKLLVIIGSNGVGKSTSAKAFLDKYTGSAFVDSDWCRAINPFPFTQETKKTVTDNLYCLIRNYLLCEEILQVVFTYGFHGERKGIFDEVIQRLCGDEEIDFVYKIIILKCDREENIRRMKVDGRDEERIARGMENTFEFYDKYNYPDIDTTEMNVAQVAEKIAEIAGIGT